MTGVAFSAREEAVSETAMRPAVGDVPRIWPFLSVT